MNQRIYIVDDEKNIRNVLEKHLKNYGYEVETFENGDAMLEAFNNSEPDLIVLDIMMPGTNGLECCEELRKKSSVPIILLTARDSELDYIQGITIGSDDYLTKPFSPTFLLMKIKALLRRVEMNKQNPQESKDYHYLDIEYKSKQNIIYCNNEKLDLTQTEYRLLLYMLENPDKVFSREELLEKVWGYEVDVETRVTDETVRRLRRKLINANSSVCIKTVWGFGYQLSETRESL